MNLLETRIHLDTLAHNFQVVQERAASAECMAVVKADAYNHGYAEVAQTLVRAGAKCFGVATLGEAFALRKVVDAPILCWMWTPSQDFAAAIGAGIELAVPALHHAKVLRAHADQVRPQQPVQVCIKIDTGMHRSGVPLTDLAQVFEVLASPYIEVTGLMSHFACADVVDAAGDAANMAQLAAFDAALIEGRRAGFELARNHIANSAGIARYPQAHYEMVRAGVAMYGMEPVPEFRLGVRPVMEWVSRVVVVKDIEPGDGVSYGLTWRADKPGRVAVVGVGYADGLWRSVQGILHVGIRGRRYPQIGRVCMDQIVIDLGDNPDQVRAEDEAFIFGGAAASATEIAANTNTIHYEVLCTPRGRTQRVYV
ncbi:MAG: alanine racemase [Corynebacterium sp.]|nr:alanine racemase [Corynebacterium sp.]